MLLNEPAQTLEILSLLYSINTEMKASCDSPVSHGENKNVYSLYIGLIQETLKSVWEKKCQISLKSLFQRALHISEPNAALWNVGGRRLRVQGRIMGLPNEYLPLFFMQSSLQLTPKKRKG